MAKRERLEVIHDILIAIHECHERMGPTRLISASNLSPKMFRDYMTELMDSSLVLEETLKGKKHYTLTKKGYKFLERYDIFTNFVENLGL